MKPNEFELHQELDLIAGKSQLFKLSSQKNSQRNSSDTQSSDSELINALQQFLDEGSQSHKPKRAETFTLEEHRKLIKLVEQVGFENVHILHQQIPSKSKSQIRSYLQEYQEKLRFMFSQCATISQQNLGVFSNYLQKVLTPFVRQPANVFWLTLKAQAVK